MEYMFGISVLNSLGMIIVVMLENVFVLGGHMLKFWEVKCSLLSDGVSEKEIPVCVGENISMCQIHVYVCFVCVRKRVPNVTKC